MNTLAKLFAFPTEIHHHDLGSCSLWCLWDMANIWYGLYLPFPKASETSWNIRNGSLPDIRHLLSDSSRLSRLSWWLFALSRSWVIRLTRWCSNSISNKEDTASAGTNECHRSMASATNDQNIETYIETSWLTDGWVQRKISVHSVLTEFQ